MKKCIQIFILLFLFLNITSSELSPLTDGTVYSIDQDISGRTDYKTKQISFGENDDIYYLKYDFSSKVPSSLITAFKIELAQYSASMSNYEVYCTNVASSASDADLISELNKIKSDQTKSSCLHIYKHSGDLESLIKLNSAKTKIGIAVYIPAKQSTTVQINLRIEERILKIDEQKPEFDDTYSMVPVTVNVLSFRAIPKSKILFYSSTRHLEMFESVSSHAFPTKLFSGNILNVYTNPLMILQKYHNATIMTLLANSFALQKTKAENFKFEVLLFESQFLLDYYVSSNPDGRPLNSPLLINMTECTSPYYVILNYNSQDQGKTLILDEIYGKISYLGVATSLEQETWEEMLENDIKPINLNDKKYNLPISANNLDVYKIECTLPVMLNFYYIDQTSALFEMDVGDVQIINLQPFDTIEVPFKGLVSPDLLIEINQPENNPYVLMTVIYENVYQENTLVKFTPMNLNKITLKERGGSSNTRVIIKVGYPERGWEEKSPNVDYNKDLDMYRFQFPYDNDDSKYFNTYADLTISGTNSENNVKFCFTTTIGGALKPSSENCYRVSTTNSYTLKVFNPFIMYKNYKYSKDLKYSVTMKPTNSVTQFGVLVNIHSYDTRIRNYEGINNKLTIKEDGTCSSILTPPEIETTSVFLQFQVCDSEHSIKAKVIDVLTKESLLPEETIAPGKVNIYRTFSNKLMDTEFIVSGTKDTNVFLRMAGLSTIYSPEFKELPEISFNNMTNTLTVESPITSAEDLTVTLLVTKGDDLVNKAYTLCSFADKKIDDFEEYKKTQSITKARFVNFQINFDNEKLKLNPGDKFDALIYFEQLNKGKMVFISRVYQDIVGEISLDTVHEINETFTDASYLYKTVDEVAPYYYFSYLPETNLEVPIGAFGIELEQGTKGDFINVYCAFVSKDADAMTMIEAVEEAAQKNTSYCLGSKRSSGDNRYNYIFKYEYEKDKTPKKMIIKTVAEININGTFHIYMKKDQGEEIVSTDFIEQKEYGVDEVNKKSVIPYIIDVEKIRGNNETSYISKILFYSSRLEMQMYYVPTGSNKPIKLFSGNIALVYTKPDLAEQKYHSKVLVLITENLEGESHTTVGSQFRFHTKMFRSSDMIEFFVSQNPAGRTLNFPLSLEMNTCSPENNKLYYLLNYNKEEPLRRLHLDMIFGHYIRARIAKEINQQHWDSLLLDSTSMSEIVDFKAELPPKTQHIEVIEITCATPLLMNAYYTKDDLFYADVEKGGVVLKMLPKQSSFQFSFKSYNFSSLEYSISLYNSNEEPDITVSFSDGTQHFFKGNSLRIDTVKPFPERVNIINHCKSETRFIFKFGLAVESSWHEEHVDGIEGKLYSNQRAFVYKFPLTANKLKYQTVDLLIYSINENPNVKFCYSTNLGTAIETSRENCFRTGKFIPYTLKFINPLIMGKNYFADTESYYVTLKPFNESDSIRVNITENKNNIENRNELGVAKELKITGGMTSTILTMPVEPMNIFFQLKLCKVTTNPILFNLSNAFTGKFIDSGKVYFKDLNGIFYTSTETYMENQIDLIGEDSNLFTKHSAIKAGYSPSINPNYTVSFDMTSNVVSIIKPILGEIFTFTVIIKKTSLEGLTICDVAFAEDKSKLGDYVNTFISESSDIIPHYVDFSSLEGYEKGTKFDILVYAEQMDNTKIEFLYPVAKGEVGTVSGTIQVKNIIEGETEYITADFNIKTASNYLYYDFPRIPTGNVASIRVKAGNTRVNKIGCTFVSNKATEEEMLSAINKAMKDGTSCCIGESYFMHTGFDSLVNAKYTSGNNRLVIQVIYGLGDNNEISAGGTANIVIKNGGTDLKEQREYPSSEPYSAIPYVIDLLKIRGNQEKNYVSKILFYSNTREMEMFYNTENSNKPVSLFTGNIMMVYTNPELIKQKYQGATTMILLTDSLSTTERFIFGETYRFISYFFTSEVNIQYFLSNNPEGRPLNNPTAVEMTSCDQPYYYIMNYNKLEGKDRKLHIDTIYGERQSIRLATKLNEGSWDKLIESMNDIKYDEVTIQKEQTKFHFDVIEIKCNVPLLVNLFYTDPEETKVTNLQMGDITIITLEAGRQETLTFKMGETGPYVYSFTIEKNSKTNPKISVLLDGKEEIIYNENGVYTKYSVEQYNNIVITNSDNSGAVSTRIIFKFGFAIEMTFHKDDNGIYSNQNDPEKIYNLYGYIYDPTNYKYNITGVEFTVSTDLDNVKFCYSTNLGTYIYPSLQNCFRVGKNNPYTISTLNPSVMFRDYVNDEHMNYYVGFRTLDTAHTIKITPNIEKYDTTERNYEGEKNRVRISSDEGEISTILTQPKAHDKFIFVETCLCTKKTTVSFQFLNAYNHSNLGKGGVLSNNQPKITVLENPKLDTEMKLSKGKNGIEIFVKHSGYNKSTTPSTQKIVIGYNNVSHILNWTQPIPREEFNYTIYFDKINLIKRQNFTICHIAEYSRLTQHSQYLVSNSKTPNVTVNFSKIGLNPKEEFDVIIVAEQLQKHKLTFMSATYDSLGGSNEEVEPSKKPDDEPKDNNKIGLIAIISVLSVAIIGGIIAAIFIFMKYRKKGRMIEENKQTSMALLNSTQQDKLVESQVQIDP